ncbi:MAG TPA: SbmA/BacA-like family transporter, partial [Bradyrhizobium sp.]|nr:SbmA/BacA-like family transporter [Bradyrhizobium sp.]
MIRQEARAKQDGFDREYRDEYTQKHGNAGRSRRRDGAADRGSRQKEDVHVRAKRADDVYGFVYGGGSGTGLYGYSVIALQTVTSLVSFSIVLWGLSANFTVPGTSFYVPGFLFWAALLYAGFGTAIAHWIGRPLVRLYFDRQRYEADFRFGLARL